MENYRCTLKLLADFEDVYPEDYEKYSTVFNKVILADSQEHAADIFHATYPIKCLDDWELIITLVKDKQNVMASLAEEYCFNNFSIDSSICTSCFIKEQCISERINTELRPNCYGSYTYSKCEAEPIGRLCTYKVQCARDTDNKKSKTAPKNKYIKEIKGKLPDGIDVYSVIESFNVTCPARQYAIKKILCTGIRGKGDSIQDLNESIQALQRALQLETERIQKRK